MGSKERRANFYRFSRNTSIAIFYPLTFGSINCCSVSFLGRCFFFSRESDVDIEHRVSNVVNVELRLVHSLNVDVDHVHVLDQTQIVKRLSQRLLLRAEQAVFSENVHFRFLSGVVRVFCTLFWLRCRFRTDNWFAFFFWFFCFGCVDRVVGNRFVVCRVAIQHSVSHLFKIVDCFFKRFAL